MATTKTTRTTKTAAYVGERATEPKVKPERAKRNAERVALIETQLAKGIDAGLKELGFAKPQDAFDAYADSTVRQVGAVRATIYCSILGYLPAANSVFMQSNHPSIVAARSSVNGIVNQCGGLTTAERVAMAKASLKWPAMSHGQALSLIRRGNTSLREINALLEKAVAEKEAAKAEKKAEKEAAKAGGKAAPRAAATVPVPAEAMTPKAEVSATAIRLMTQLHSVKYAKPVSNEELRLLKNVLDGFIERIA